MAASCFEVKSFQGKTARLQIVDNFTTGWGNIGVDEIVFTDQKVEGGKLTEQRDFGSMTLTLIGNRSKDYAFAAKEADKRVTAELHGRLVGTIGTKLKLKPG